MLYRRKRGVLNVPLTFLLDSREALFEIRDPIKMCSVPMDRRIPDQNNTYKTTDLFFIISADFHRDTQQVSGLPATPEDVLAGGIFTYGVWPQRLGRSAKECCQFHCLFFCAVMKYSTIAGQITDAVDKTRTGSWNTTLFRNRFTPRK